MGQQRRQPAQLPESIGEPRRQMLETIEGIRKDTTVFYSRPHQPFEDYLLDGATSLCVMGDRGAGKSTLLVAVCAELVRRGNDIVLPIQTPESFAAHDTVISAFLASLWRFLVSAEGDVCGDDAERNDLRDLVSRTAQAHAAARIPLGALEHGTDNPRDYAADAVSASRSYSRVGEMLRDVARRACAGGAANRLIVVPIDDPDFQPTSIRGILRDVRQLGSIPGIVPISCVCPSDLEFGWEQDGHERRTPASHKNLPRELEKVFPYRSRVELRPVPGWERPDFTPIGKRRTLGQRVETLSKQATPIPWCVDEFVARDSGPPHLASPLPSNRRALVQLWEVLEPPKRGGRAGEANRVALLRRVIDIVSEPLRGFLGMGLGETFYEVAFRQSGAAEGRPRIAFEGLQRLVVGVSAVGNLDATPSLRDAVGLADIRIRPIARVTGHLRPEDPNRRSGTASSTTPSAIQLKPEVLASFFAVNEFVHGPSVFAVDGSTLGVGVEEWTWLSRVTLAGRSTDDNFLSFPFCRTYSEVGRGITEWNELAAASAQGISVEALLAQNIAGALRILDSGKRRNFRSYADALGSAARRYTDVATTVPGHPFARWFENDLPAHFHEAFFTPTQLEKFCAIHRAGLETVPSRDDGPPVSGEFVARIQGLLASADGEEALDRMAWVGGYHEAAANIGIGDVAKLRELQLRWREHATRTRAGAFLTGDLVLLGSGGVDFAAYETPEGAELLMRARAYLERRTADEQRRQREQRPRVV